MGTVRHRSGGEAPAICRGVPDGRGSRATDRPGTGLATWSDISRSGSAMVRALHDYWSSKRGSRRMARRADIDPTEIKTLLPNLLLVDLVGEPLRVRYRLVGTRVVAATGLDFTGRHLDEIVPANVDTLWHDCYRKVRGDVAAVYGETTIPSTDGPPVTYEFGIFPLGPDDACVTQCLAIEDYGRVNAHLTELMEKSELKWTRDRDEWSDGR